MSKKTRSTLALLCVLALVLAGCGSSQTTPAGASSSQTPAASSAPPPSSAAATVQPAPEALKELLLSTSTSTSSYYAIGQGIVDLINKGGYGFSMSATTSGGTEDNLVRIESGEAELGIGFPDSVYYASKGMGDYEGRAINVSSLCSMWVNPLNIVVRADSGITDVTQLKGKRLGCGPVGTATRSFPEVLFPILGFSIEDCNWTYAPISDQCDKLKDGQIDAIIMTMGPGNSSLTDLAATTDVVFLPLSMDTIDKIHEKIPFYGYTMLPAGTYRGIDADLDCVGFNVNLYASNDRVSEQQAYDILSAIYSEPGILSRYHSVGNDCTLETALVGLATDLHPGAQRFYKEKGML